MHFLRQILILIHFGGEVTAKKANPGRTIIKRYQHTDCHDQNEMIKHQENTFFLNNIVK